MLKHIYRIIMIHIFNLFSGMHFWNIKRKILNLIPDMSVGENTRIVGPIWAGSVSKINIGSNTFVNRQFNVEGNGIVRIGDNVDIAPGVKILTGGHCLGSKEHRAGEGISYKINIGEGCWIGAYSIIFGNTDIGNGCVVGAGTVVNKGFPPNTLIVGNAGTAKKSIDDLGGVIKR